MKSKLLCSFIMSVSILYSSMAIAGVTKTYIIPSLPVSATAKAFMAKYPNTAIAVQMDLYSGNAVAHITNEAYVLNGGKAEKYPSATLRQLKKCNKNLYTAANIEDIFQRLNKYLSADDFAQLETFYGLPIGQHYLNAKVTVAEEFKNKNLRDVQNLEDSPLGVPIAEQAQIDKFLVSSPARAYELNFLTKKLRQENLETKQCIGKIIGRDLT